MRRGWLGLAILALTGCPLTGVGAGAGTDVPREFFALMVDLPGFSGPPADGSRVVMSGQLALSVSRTYQAESGDARLSASLQASSAMSTTWQEALRAAGAHRRRLAGFPAVSRLVAGSAASRVVVKLGTSPFAVFVLEGRGLGERTAVGLAKRFPLGAMQEALAHP